ncbi:OmpA family protein [Cellulomonas endophytica]|uniref:OmpA family protein n=1 Tax=Cellulomonas endophytica TaxID=2494735 RepID=UPI0010109ED3|nr:OmpA family protein [Cellulomonas endophytica]
MRAEPARTAGRARTRGVATAALVALVAAGCTGGDGDAAPSPEGTSTGTATGATRTPRPTPTPTAEAVAPVVVDTWLEGERLELEVGPLAVHDDVAVLRLAAAPQDTPLVFAFFEVFESINNVGPNGVRLLDRAPGTVLLAARTAEDRLVMTGNQDPGGPATEAAEAAVGEDVDVLHVAFAVPEGDTVDVVLAQGGTVADVPVVDAKDAGTLTVPPEELADGPVDVAPVLPVESFTEALGGQVRTRETPEQVTVDVSSDVLFASDSDALGPEAEGALSALAAQVGPGTGGTLTVVGHTDDVDDEAYNLDLSQRRAAAVSTRLAQLVDLSGWTVAVEGRGESEPVAQGRDAAARAANRRVQVVLVPTEPAAPEGPVLADEGAALAEPAGPVGTGAEGVTVQDDDQTFTVRLPEVRRLGARLVGELEITNTGATDLSLTAMATGAWDSRGAFDPTLVYSATNLTIPVGSNRLYPLDYLRSAERGTREPLTDRSLNGIAPGTTYVLSVVWPDPGTDTVVVEVAPRRLEAYGGVEPLSAPFRLTDVPVVEG